MGFLFQIPIDLTSLASNGGAYWTFIQKFSVSFLFFYNIVSENDSKIISKTLFGLEIFEMSNDKILVVEINFSGTAFENLPDKARSKLSETAQDLFNILNQFAMLHKVKSKIKSYLVKNPVQNIESDYCGVFQLYFDDLRS